MERFEEWIGNNYRRQSSDRFAPPLRLLLLGESHYGEPSARGSRFTIEWIEKTIDHKATYFFKRFPRAVVGDKAFAAFDRFWHDVAFTNFIPFIPVDRAGVSPSDEDFAAGAACYAGQLASIQPDAVVVCGYRLWGHIQSFFDTGGDRTLRAGRVLGLPHLPIPHVSRSVGYSKTSELLRALVKDAGLETPFNEMRSRWLQ